MNFREDEYIVVQVYPEGMEKADANLRSAIGSQHLWTRIVYIEPIFYIILGRNESFTHRSITELHELLAATLGYVPGGRPGAGADATERPADGLGAAGGANGQVWLGDSAQGV